MMRAFFAGAGRALAFWPLALALWLVNAVFAAAFALASAYWLAMALDASVARRTLVSDLDPDILVDLYLNHGASFRILLVVGAVVAIGHGVLWIWLHALIVAGLRPDADSEASSRKWSAGLRHGGVFARLFALAGGVLAVFTAAIVAGAWLGLRWTAASTTAWLSESIVAGAALAWLGGLIVLVAVHDHARIRAVASAQGAWASYRWAWRFVLRGGERALWLALALQISGAALWVAYQLVGLRLPVGEVIGVTGALLWGELFLAARVWMRIWFFAAQNELQA